MWQTWYFSLIDNKLSYAKAMGHQPKGTIIITSPNAVSLTTEVKKPAAFRIEAMKKNKKRIYYICAETQADAVSWVQDLKRAPGGGNSAIMWLDEIEVVRVVSRKENGGENQIVKKRDGDGGDFFLERYPRKIFDKVDKVLEDKQTFRRAQNPYVSTVMSVMESMTELAFLYEYVTHGCLFGHLWDEGKFQEERVVLYAAEIACGIDFMHGMGVTYGDLSPKTVLLMKDGHIRISHPGLNSSVKKISPYTSPESCDNKPVTKQSDWYSYGALVYEMLTGMAPFYAENETDMKKAIWQDKIRFPHHVSETAREFVMSLMEKDPSARLGQQFSDIREHPFFAAISWSDVLAKTTEPIFIPGDSPNNHETVSYDLF